MSADGPTSPAPRAPLRFGEALAFIRANANRNSSFALGSLAGRFVLMCAVQNTDAPEAREALAAIPRDVRDETFRLCAIFATAAADTLAPFANRLVFTDADASATAGLADPTAPNGRWILFDRTLRVRHVWPLNEAQAALAALEDATDAPANAPVLVAPNVFEPDFCAVLIAYYEKNGGEASGITQQDPTGRTFVTLDDAFKRREDCTIEDAAIRDAAMKRIYWRLAPMIERAFMWTPTRMERYLIARYDAQSGGFFKPHRDNTTKGTAHRRFAVTINLNAEAYEGGDLRFPEFGPQTYRAPTGGAVVFSCSLMHEATPVTKGQRFAFLPFLYDEAAAKLREANNKFLDESIATYSG